MVRMCATLTLKPAGEFKDMHKTLIVAADFASAARGWYARWKILLNADVIHNDFGQGSVTLVADRGGASPLLTICFLKGGLKQFNPDSFSLGGFQSISLSSQKAEFVSEWLDEVNRVTAALEQERKILEEKAQTRTLRAAEVKGIAEEFSVTVAQAQRSELASVLMRIKAGDQLDSKELSWLKEEGMFGVLAAYFEDRYDLHQKLWSLVKACSNLRKVQKAKRALLISSPEVLMTRHTYDDSKPRSALLTTRGGAHRDVGDLVAAKDCGEAALKLEPHSQYAHSLLGAVYYRLGEPAIGDDNFVQAERFGGSAKASDREREVAFRESSPAVQQKIAMHLYSKDPEKNGWALRYMSEKNIDSARSS